MKKRYYRVIKFYTSGITDVVWHCSHETASNMPCDAIIPLSKKPHNVEIREGN